ncbi:MAG TPA: hypothetical protein VI957_01600 [Candidatus Paceibacterota bacterium]
MSENAAFNIVLAAFVALMAFTVGSFAAIPPLEGVSGILASPYCAEGYGWPEITARAAYVEDLSTNKVLFEKNAEAQLPLASLTKLMTVYVALDSLVSNDYIEIPLEALKPEGDAGLYAHEIWLIRDLVDFTLMSSANDGAHALALLAGAKRGLSEGGFIFLMNETAKSLNMAQSVFLNDTGLDVASSTPGAMGSARDIGFLLRHIFTRHSDAFAGSTLPEHTFVSASNFTHHATNTSVIGSIAPKVIISKTGSTKLAGGNLALVFEPLLGHPVAAVVLGSTEEARETDMELLVFAAADDLKRRILCNSGI